MRKILNITVILLLILGVKAQSQVTISGETTNLESPVKLYKVFDGQLEQIAQARPNQAGNFGFYFYPEYEGLFVLGYDNDQSLQKKFKFYLKKEDRLSISLTNDTLYTLSGKSNSKENQVLNKWYNLTKSLEQKSVYFDNTLSTFVDYFPAQEITVKESKDFLKGKQTGNAKFDAAIKDIIKLDLAILATNFVSTPRTAHPKIEEYSDFYSTLKASDFAKNTSLIYNYPYGKRLLLSLIYLNKTQAHLKDTKTAWLEEDLKFVPNDTLKGDVVLSYLKGIKSEGEFDAKTRNFVQFFITDHQKKQINAIKIPLLTYKGGSPAFNFSYPDEAGKNRTLSDFKDKYVFVDIWATWCKPCVDEIPYLQKLEEDLKGKNIEFISISVDAGKDKAKWLNMIKDKKLSGVQLFSSGGQDILDYYKIAGIPRFMIFDKTGKIIRADAPRPSDPELKNLIQKIIDN
ncbi:TlpA family protein disulfide reductase [Pedobacter sp. SG918]|uniref:TlpA family protein disulfide reductase n=1 Tax=Pedobacter sp. SG918 TaxID=2587136 RepID=UPI00146D0862|nr:TlpA disulfide reductase family protein [Pedobacter sp. SG918]NMN38121.1 thiol-disulfide isomerase/thioredoxin [Pedobacter sp. SG918]